MDPQYKPMTEFLRQLGIEQIGHTSKSYLAHLVAVYRDLESWGCGRDVCRGGMFHSIYGTELFQGFTLPLERRQDVRELIGARAEQLAYLNCAMDRPSFDQSVATNGPSRRFGDRISGETIELAADDFDDLCRIHLCDWLEQVPRSRKWDYRRPAYASMARHLGGVAWDAYDQVFAEQA